MQRYIVRRLLFMIPTILVLTLITFGLLRIMPGDYIVAQMSETRGVNPVQAERWRAELGLDVAAHIQYVRWVSGIFTGDWGTSFWHNQPVLSVIGQAAPITLQLGIMSILIGILIAIPVGVSSAIYQDKWVDYLGRSISIAGISIPNFFLATLVIIYGARWLGYFPPSTYQNPLDDPLGNAKQFLPAALVLGTALSAQSMRMIRTTMLETLREDYVRTARSKGVAELHVIFRHAFRNALIPVVTLLGFQIATTVGGSVIVEQVFSMNGVGRMYINAVYQRDYPLVQGILLVIVFSTLLINLFVDLSYSWLDPRIRYS